VTSLQYLPDLWRTHDGSQRLDCLIIGKVFRWRQIRTQDALSVPQSPFDQAIVLHEWRKHRESAGVVYNSTVYHVIRLWSLNVAGSLLTSSGSRLQPAIC
jgi:hypothetical protein